MKKKILLTLAIILIGSFGINVNAESFTQPERFTYYLYRNSDTPLTSGTGLLDSYGGSGYNRVQFLYNLYTFDSNYLYDITFTTYFSGNGGTGVLTANVWAESCSIYTGSGAQYNCSYTGGYDGNQVYMRSTINNMVGTDLNTLWLNFYSSGVSAVNLLQNSYKLEINRKENKNVTSENLQNATDSIINNQNQNNNALRSDINDGVDHILDGQNNIINKDHTYNNNPSENIQGQNDMNNMTNAEDNLMNNLDFSGASEVNVSINPESSNFIWDIVNKLREMNPAIVTLMTSILGLGIFKLILNR